MTDGIVRRLLNKLETRIDRWTHTRARQAARRRAQLRRTPARIVVVCYGNICRSPYAEAALRRAIASGSGDDIAVDSAGFIGPGRPANDQARTSAARRGVNLDRHRSRLVTAEDARTADLFLVMTRTHRAELIRRYGVGDRVELLGDFDVDDPPDREIPDPYGKPEAEFDRVFEQIDRSVRGLVLVWAERGRDERSAAAGAVRSASLESA